MKALISPLEPKENGVRIAQVEPDDKIFVVAEPLYWFTCPDDCNADTWYFNTQLHQCVEIPPYVPSADDNKNQAKQLLSETDWTTIPDVTDPTKSNPYLANSSDFVAYRNELRAIVFNPQAGWIDFPTIPNEDWQSV